MSRVTTKLLLAFFALSLIGVCPVLGEAAESPLADMYAEYLKSEGYFPTVDKDGDVFFKYEGSAYFILVDEDDPQFFVVIYPTFWKIDSESEKTLARKVALEVTNSTKGAKVFLDRQEMNVSINAETLLKQPEDFKDVFPRILNMISSARKKFIKGMRGDN
ncbi:MAG: hypothetical protein LBC93_07100 [Synergistaceae bacterium]|jgi:hypothetical protein|nr:hypothetical protein [Synergistaceae bacterium]